MVNEKVAKLLEISLENGNLLVVEDEETLNSKIKLHWIKVLIYIIIGFVFLGIAFDVFFNAISGDPPRYVRYLGVLFLLLTFVPLSLAGYHMILPTYLRKMKFYDNGIAFMVMDWFEGPSSVHLPWSELGKFARRTHWRLGRVVYLPKHKLVVLESMMGFEKVLPFIEDNLIEDFN